MLVFFCFGCIKQKEVPLNSFSAKQSLASISSAVSRTGIMKAMAQIELVTQEGYYPARAALVLMQPSYLRLELLPLMGPPDFFLAVTPGEMKILLPAKNEFYQGKSTGYNLARFLPWQFNVEEIIAIFAGTYPSLEGDISYQSDMDGDELRIKMKSQSGKTQIVWVESGSRLVRLVRYDENEKELYNAKFEEYEEGIPIARKIIINMAGNNTSVTVKYSDLEIEKTADLSIFDLPIPAGFKIINMD